MANRMSRCAALIGTLLSLNGFAQECQEISLYKSAGDQGKMLEGSTFPESPEWTANWGNLGGMEPPYIRLSGQKNSGGDWKGELSFSKLPVYVKGGNLKVKLRSTQKGRAAIWLAGNFGKSSQYYTEMDANKTYDVTVPLSALNLNGIQPISQVGVGLMNVPVYQYTTLFVDDIALTCGASSSEDAPTNSSGSILGEQGKTIYPYSDIHPENATRKTKFLDTPAGETSAAFSQKERKQMLDSTSMNFVVSLFDYTQIKRYETATELTPKQSRQGWMSSLHKLEAHRLKDSVIANPKQLLYEAEAYVASSDKRAMPLLVGNVDYGYRSCVDSSCVSQVIKPARLLLAGLPSSTVHGSVFKIFYDPYFLTTNRTTLPVVEIKVHGIWEKIAPKSEKEIRFEAAGTQKIQVRLTEGGITTTQTLFVEVK